MISGQDIKELKQYLRREVSSSLGRDGLPQASAVRDMISRLMDQKTRSSHQDITESLKRQIIDELCDDAFGFGPLEKLLKDGSVSEIMVNGPGKTYVERDGKKILTPVHFDDDNHLRYIIEKMMISTGRRIDESSPYVDFSLPDGARVNAIIPPVATGGAVVTIRKMLADLKKVEDVVRLGTMDDRMAEFLVACIKSKVNILFSGATGSGKTTLLEILSAHIDAHERIVTIEDTLELSLRQEHVVRLLTKPTNIEGKGEITIKDLFRNSLRMRPSRIILGEIRGEEAMDYLQALNSGHRGCLAVIHSARPSEAIHRLETMSMYAGLNVNTAGVRRYISSGLNLIVQLEQFVDGTRKVTYVTEVGQLTDQGLLLRDIFRFEIEGVDEKDHVQGSFKAMSTPGFLSLFRKRGVSVNANIFKPDATQYEPDYWLRW